MTNSGRSALTDVDHLECEHEIIEIPLLLETINPEDPSNNENEHRIYTNWAKCCVYRAPRKLRSVNEAAYTPQMVSIGPFHHGKPGLRALEPLKSRYFDEFCWRACTSRDYLEKIIDEDCEKRIRACYAGTFQPIIKGGFVGMVVTDAGFIIELLLRRSESDKDDYILCKPWLANCIKHDLILLENQLPFFVLEKIFNHVKPAICSNNIPLEGKSQKNIIKEDSTFLGLTCNYFFKDHNPTHSKYLTPEVKHFTDLLRSYFCHSMLESNNGSGRIKSSRHAKKLNEARMDFKVAKSNYLGAMRHAMKLNEAGVDFEAAEDNYLGAITFRQGRCLRHCPCCNFSWLLNWLPCLFQRRKCKQPTLVLPRFEVDDMTECVFRNLMALEQCHYPNETYICNYVSLMDKLINTAEDVELLIDKNVITNFLGSSKAVAELLNKLCQHIVEQNSCFYACVQDINGHCKNPMNRIMATLKSVYFLDFWRGTATIVGIIVLGISIWSLLLRHIL